MPQEKTKNLISVTKYRERLKEQMGEGAYKAKMAEAKRLQREKAKIKKAEEIRELLRKMLGYTYDLKTKPAIKHKSIRGKNLSIDKDIAAMRFTK